MSLSSGNKHRGKEVKALDRDYSIGFDAINGESPVLALKVVGMALFPSGAVNMDFP